MDNLIDKYLIDRGLWEPKSAIKEGEANVILDDPEKLALVAGLFNTYGTALAWVLQEKIKVMALELIREARPPETIIIRQTMIDVSSIWDECEKYSLEYAKRQGEKEGNGEPTPPIEDNVPPEDNEAPGL